MESLRKRRGDDDCVYIVISVETKDPSSSSIGYKGDRGYESYRGMQYLALPIAIGKHTSKSAHQHTIQIYFTIFAII